LAFMARISPLIVGLMLFSVLTEILTLTVVSLLVVGGWQVFTALFTVTMKLLIISLASVTVFTTLDPERLSDALLKFGLPERYCFAISYAYRMLPILIEEYHNIFNSYRLRGQRPPKASFYPVRLGFYYVKIAVISFYPMMLNTAKRVRTTVEVLETKGFTYAGADAKVKEMRLSYMKIQRFDFYFVLCTIIPAILTLIV
ncbi:MAG: energy-coupling factor transporter transmembrane component T family protein, partial [Bacilli bacterium]